MAIERVSCIGLGRMGTAIAENIGAAGFDLTVHNRTPAKMQLFADKGVRTAESPQVAAAGADAVVTTLMDDASVFDVTTGSDGILAGLAPGAVHICMTTISPATADRLAALHAEHGSHYLAAPVLGRPDVAAAGQLRTFVAGPSGVIESCRALFAAFTSAVIPVGERAGIANVLKLCANFTIAAWIELAGEVYTLAEKNGAQPEIVNGILDAIGAGPALSGYSQRIRTRDFDAAGGFAMTAGLKDVELVLATAAAARVPLPFAAVVRDKVLAALAQGMDERDWSAITDVTRAQSGLD